MIFGDDPPNDCKVPSYFMPRNRKDSATLMVED